MKKVYLLNIIFLIICVFVLIPLTIEVFGDMNTNVITVCSIILGIGLIGNCVCVIVRAIQAKKDK